MDDTKLHLGIEAGEVLLKVALYDPKEKKVVKTAILNTETNPLDDVSSFEAALQNWLAENEGVQIDTVSLTVSSFRAIVRQLFVPPEAKNVREYLQWYLSNLVNADVNDYVMDFVELGGSAELGRTVLMIAMRKVWVNSIRKGFRNQQIAPKILEVDALSLMNLLEQSGTLDGKLQCVIKADVTGVMLLWASKNDLRALRCCSTLDLAGKEREEAYAQLSENIAKQVEDAALANGTAVEQYLLCGELATDLLFVENLRKALGDKPITQMDSFAEIRLPVDEESASHVLSCAGAIGVALRSTKQ
ncbi:MAG: hypothetical protein J6Z31_06385 [Fibrobacter sp.]|nr:hypothetical protein [Fibrobacter sp.]